MLARAALGGIWVYQRWVSPRKGWRCAHAVLHGGSGCSGYAKHALRAHGLRAIPLIRARFADCRTAHGTLLMARADDERTRRGRTRRGRCEAACDNCSICAAPPPFPCLGGRAATSGGSKGCDTNPCDGDIGCGGIDFCSCG